MTDATPADGQPGVRSPQKPTVAPAVAGPSAGLWGRMREDPQYAPEHLALAAVRQLGPEAAQWARWVRAEQPGMVPVEALADQAVRRFVNYARFPGAASGTTGLPGLVIDVGLLAWTQARMVLHVAAAYGLDATHHDRAVDLLVLQKVHKAEQGARLALGVAAGRERWLPVWSRGGAPTQASRPQAPQVTWASCSWPASVIGPHRGLRAGGQPCNHQPSAWVIRGNTTYVISGVSVNVMISTRAGTGTSGMNRPVSRVAVRLRGKNANQIVTACFQRGGEGGGAVGSALTGSSVCPRRENQPSTPVRRSTWVCSTTPCAEASHQCRCGDSSQRRSVSSSANR